jgi:8-oxo-dGTP pyrophosphatase MutT (NUDIX family)
MAVARAGATLAGTRRSDRDLAFMARTPVMGAGGIVVRSDAPLIAVVRLRKRDHWVLPKGKLDSGEATTSPCTSSSAPSPTRSAVDRRSCISGAWKRRAVRFMS